MPNESGTIPFESEFKLLVNAYDLSSTDGVEFLLPDAMILSPAPGKVGVYLKILDVVMRLPLTDF